MSCDNYVLGEGGLPRLERDLVKWATWFETADRQVNRTQIEDCIVSTVFLGIDHQFGDGPPILWETMVFGGAMNEEQARCSGSREQAEAMHQEMVERVEAVLAINK